MHASMSALVKTVINNRLRPLSSQTVLSGRENMARLYRVRHGLWTGLDCLVAPLDRCLSYKGYFMYKIHWDFKNLAHLDRWRSFKGLKDQNICFLVKNVRINLSY